MLSLPAPSAARTSKGQLDWLTAKQLSAAMLHALLIQQEGTEAVTQVPTLSQEHHHGMLQHQHIYEHPCS